MIKSAVIAMTLLGCDCDAKVCTYIGETPAQWASVSECEAAMKSQVLARSKLDYPLVTAECRALASTPAVLEVKAGVQAAAVPVVAPAVPETASLTGQIAERAVVTFRRTADGYGIVKSGISTAADAVIGRATTALSTTAGWLRY